MIGGMGNLTIVLGSRKLYFSIPKVEEALAIEYKPGNFHGCPE